MDDSALPRMRSKRRGNRRDRGRSATNRYSLGDYNMFNNDLDDTRGELALTACLLLI